MKWRAQRWVVKFPTKATTEQTSNPLTITSVSTSGARVQGDHNFSAGEKICISCLTDRISATVVWVKPGAFGLKFTCPVGQKHLSTMRKPGGANMAPWKSDKRVSSVHGFREL